MYNSSICRRMSVKVIQQQQQQQHAADNLIALKI